MPKGGYGVINQLTSSMTEAERIAIQNSNNNALELYRATLDPATGKVNEDPKSYGQADGGAVLPHTLPTSPVIVQLSGGTLSVMTLPAKGTLLMVGDNNMLVAATEAQTLLTAVNFSNYGGTYEPSRFSKLGNRVEGRGLVGANSASVSSGTVMMHIPDSSFWPSATRSCIAMALGTTPTFASIDVTSGGDIVLRTSMTNTPWVWLDTIVYSL